MDPFIWESEGTIEKGRKIVKPSKSIGYLGLIQYLVDLNLWRQVSGILYQTPQVMPMQTKITVPEGCLMRKNEDLGENLISIHFFKIWIWNSFFFFSGFYGVPSSAMLFNCLFVIVEEICCFSVHLHVAMEWPGFFRSVPFCWYEGNNN